MTSLRDAEKCFVIIPFGEKKIGTVKINFDHIFDELIVKACAKAGMAAVKASEHHGKGPIITRHIFDEIYDAAFVIADVTYYNPNVFYELGVRHALRKFGTQLIRCVGGDFIPASRRKKELDAIAFDIMDVSVHPYEFSKRALQQQIAALAEVLCESRAHVVNSSPVFNALEGLQVIGPIREARQGLGQEFTISDLPDVIIGYRTGSVENAKGEHAIDYWCNSENTDMEMPRMNERSISSRIRFLGAKQPDRTKPNFEDTIACALKDAMGNRLSLAEGDCIDTPAGRLEETHQVKRIVHVAAVTGSPVDGWRIISGERLRRAVRNVISYVNDLAKTYGGDSMFLPVFGAGQGQGIADRLAPILVSETIETIRGLGKNRRLRKIFFIAFSEEETRLFRRLFDQEVSNKQVKQRLSGAARSS